MNTIFLISIYSVLLLCLFTFIFIRAREEIIGLSKKYQGIVGITKEPGAPDENNDAKKGPQGLVQNLPVNKTRENKNYDRSLQDILNERKKEKKYISESIAA